MKRPLCAILLLLLGSGAWGQSQPGVGLSISPVPGSGPNAGASTLRVDLGGSNPSAPASSSLGLALSPSLSLSPKVSASALPAASVRADAARLFAPQGPLLSVQQAAPGLSPALGLARQVPGRSVAAEPAREAREAAARDAVREFQSGALQAEEFDGMGLAPERRGRLKDLHHGLAALTQEFSKKLDGVEDAPGPAPVMDRVEGRPSRTGLSLQPAGSETPVLVNEAIAGQVEAVVSFSEGLAQRAAADIGPEETPSPTTSAPSRSGEQPPSGDGGPLAADPEPFKLPLWKRALAVTGILGFLAAAPSLLNAAALQTVGQAVLPSISAGSVLSIFTQNAALLLSPWAWGVAGALALIGLPLRIFVFRLSPWSMSWLKDPGNGLAKKPLWMLLPLLAVAAASEELTFRAMAFGLSFVFLSTLMAAPLALAAASFLSSLVFALIHGYGPVWTRVVGGMLYSAAFAVTGSLLFITLAHMLFNLRALSLARRSNGQ